MRTISQARELAAECAKRKKYREDYASENCFAVAARRADDLIRVQRIVAARKPRIKLLVVAA